MHSLWLFDCMTTFLQAVHVSWRHNNHCFTAHRYCNFHLKLIALVSPGNSCFTKRSVTGVSYKVKLINRLRFEYNMPVSWLTWAIWRNWPLSLKKKYTGWNSRYINWPVVSSILIPHSSWPRYYSRSWICRWSSAPKQALPLTNRCWSSYRPAMNCPSLSCSTGSWLS